MKTLIFPPTKNKAGLLFAPSICPFVLSIYDGGRVFPWKAKANLFTLFYPSPVFCLFIVFGCAGSSLLLGRLSRRGARASHCGCFSCYAVWTLLGLDILWYVGSSQTRIKLRYPALAGGFLTLGPPGKPLLSPLLFILSTHQAFSRLRAFAWAFPSAQSALPPVL